jgi:hypothetical protein
MYFSYTGKYFRMYFQKDWWKNKKGSRAARSFQSPLERAARAGGEARLRFPNSWLLLYLSVYRRMYCLNVGKNRTDSGIFKDKPEVLELAVKQGVEKGILLLLECQAAPEKDFWVWEKNVNAGQERKPLDAEGILAMWVQARLAAGETGTG